MRPLEREHPTDERLLTLYFNEGAAPVDDEATTLRQHLHGCEACTWRYSALTAPLQQLRLDASSEADEVFTPGRLAAQRSAIRHRLENASGTPRVVPFPGATPAPRRFTHRPAARWMAGAAAAGLLVGVSAGRLMRITDRTPAASPAQVTRSVEAPRLLASRPVPAVAASPVASEPGANELNVLYGLDSATRRPRVAELSALDELTPHPEMQLALGYGR